MIINKNEQVNLTLAQKQIRVKKRIGNMFLQVKKGIDDFDAIVLQILNNNKMGLTQQEVLGAFDSSEQTELQKIRQDLKTLADTIEEIQ